MTAEHGLKNLGKKNYTNKTYEFVTKMWNLWVAVHRQRLNIYTLWTWYTSPKYYMYAWFHIIHYLFLKNIELAGYVSLMKFRLSVLNEHRTIYKRLSSPFVPKRKDQTQAADYKIVFDKHYYALFFAVSISLPVFKLPFLNVIIPTLQARYQPLSRSKKPIYY